MKKTAYIAKAPDSRGIIHYTAEENLVWDDLIHRQRPIVAERACQEYLRGLEILDFPAHQIPQLTEVQKKLAHATGWSVTPVPALITPDHFFELLSHRKFPAATFIRSREELDYLQEPDIFHEFFGHCPMLTDPVYADFMQKYGKLGTEAKAEDKAMLARIYWFTVEFGLIKTQQGLRVYGGGILSSMGETPYSLESNIPMRKPFDILEALRTPYRIDIKQPIYFVIPSFETLYDLLREDLQNYCKKARKLGMHPPSFPIEEGVVVY